MTLRLLAPALAAVLLFTGCAASASPDAQPTATATAAPSATATAESTPAVAQQLVVTVDGVDVIAGGDRTTYAGAELVSLIEELTGTPAVVSDLEGPYGGVVGERYEWEPIIVLLSDDGSTSVAVRAAMVADVPVVTEDGISVGSSREQVVAAGGRDLGDADGDGVADGIAFAFAEREVPGTESLGRPGEVGVQFVLVIVTGDAVTQIQSPGNDYSDI